MKVHHHQMQIDKQEEKQLNPPPNSATTSSSPPYEFTFTVSLHPSAATNIPERNKSPLPPPFAAIDLSPADDIFFHGHLLPLHLLSHLSPRSSTNSLLDSFTLPIKELSSIHNHNNTRSFDDDDDDRNTIKSSHHQESSLLEGKIRSEKPKQPFSVFGLPRWRKGGHNHHHQQQQHHHQEEHDHHHRRQKTKSKFDVSGVMQRYMRLIKPFLVSFRSKYRRGNMMNTNNPQQTIDHQRQHQLSFSGNLKVRRKKGYLMRGRRGEYSAPASMRNSPTNSGLLVQSGGSGNLTPTCNKSDSTMEELQAAIQAAIAHCKKSISKEDIS